MPKARKGDWLSEHAEKGQSVAQFQNSIFKAAPHATYNTIAMVIIGEGLSAEQTAALRDYVQAFYQLDVCIVGPVPLAEIPDLRTRINADTQQRQLFAKPCMEFAAKRVSSDRDLSRRVVATIGVTMEDITNRDDWNFVYGLAAMTEGVGVFSLHRFAPSFNGERCATAADEDRLVVERACKVVCHELGHLFGLKHCINRTCLMNGANHVGELQRQPLIECPFCTEKLLMSFAPYWGNMAKRYLDMERVLRTTVGRSDVADVIVSAVLPVLPTPAGSEASAVAAADRLPPVAGSDEH